MSLLKNLESWTSTHNPKWLALFRVALGAALLLRGVAFLNNLVKFEQLLDQNGLGAYKAILMNTIPWIHIGGGFLIIIGLFTRFASFIQIPVLLGAVIFINSRNFFAAETDLSLSVILLLLLLVFVVEGSGPLSLANYFKEEDEAQEAADQTAIE